MNARQKEAMFLAQAVLHGECDPEPLSPGPHSEFVSCGYSMDVYCSTEEQWSMSQLRIDGILCAMVIYDFEDTSLVFYFRSKSQ